MSSNISKLGPPTRQPLFPDLVLCDGICGTEMLYRILFGITFLTDIVLTILQGLDAVDKGPNTPWIPFILSGVIGIAYSILLVIAVVISYWDRLLEFKSKWVFLNLITTVVMWSSFGLIASWITWYGSNSKTLRSDDPAFISWIAINAVAVVLFLLRFISLIFVCGLQYVYMRSIELSSYAALAGKHGKHLNDYLIQYQEETAGGSFLKDSESQFHPERHHNQYLQPAPMVRVPSKQLHQQWRRKPKKNVYT